MTLPKYHWKKDLPDARDHIYRPTLTLQQLPVSVDLRVNCSSIEDQGQIGSCTGNAIAGIVEYLSRKNKKYVDVSRLFIYYEERILEGTQNYDAGAYLRDGIKVVNKKGAPLESLWPYSTNRVTVRPTQAAYTNALTRKALSYQRCTNINSIKASIANGFPVTMGFIVYESFESGTWWYPNDTGLMPYPNVNTEQILGGHAICLVGYNDATQTFIGRNSWGTSWGKRGYFYVPYQVVEDTNMSDDFWTITKLS